MKIAFLKDYPEYIDELNGLFFCEWSFIYPESDKNEWKERLIARTNGKEIPTTIIAIEKGQVLGSAAIVKNDMRTRLDLSPWLGGVYVKRDQRLKGIGSRLVKAVEDIAKELGIEKLHLYTLDRENFYKQLGWKLFEKTIYQDIKVSIMVKEIAPDRSPVRLMELTLGMEEQFKNFLEDFERQDQVGRWLFEYKNEPFDEFVGKLKGHKLGKHLPKGWVPYTTFFLLGNDGRVLGKSSLRHTLTDHLRAIGGEHIGYFIRQSERRKGYGTEILRLTLEKAKELGLERVLVTCDEDNIASAKIIERNGGVLEDTYQEDDMAVPKRRYWIELDTEG